MPVQLTDANRQTSERVYEDFLRNCAYEARSFEREPLKRAEMAIIVEEFPDVWDEAMTDVPTEDIVTALESPYAHVELGNLITIWLRRRCTSYIAKDVQRAKDEFLEATRQDREYEREST